jgi:uncharacterized protein YwgA
MVEPIDVARLIALNGGRLVGKTRLQKSAYFLEAEEIGFGFDFDFHLFGPYSEELSDALDDATALDLVDIEWVPSQIGTRYAVFKNRAHIDSDEKDHRRREILDVLRKYSATEVELAATAHFLKHHWHVADPWRETEQRKPKKVTDERLAKAKQLLAEVDSLQSSLPRS